MLLPGLLAATGLSLGRASQSVARFNGRIQFRRVRLTPITALPALAATYAELRKTAGETG